MAGDAERRAWSREEHVMVFNLYCKIPFGTIHMRNPQVIDLASLIGRSVGAVSYKLANFSRLDPSLQARGIQGLSHGAKGEIEVWEAFYDDPAALIHESEKLLAQRNGQSIELSAGISETELPREGLERESMVMLRVNQNFFRKAVLAAYECKCCVTGIASPELLVASHISPWAFDENNRVNPRNGLCLNALHDRAFDRGLMSVTPDGHVRFSDRILERGKGDVGLKWLLSFDGKAISMPSRFLPDSILLEQHFRRAFAD